MKQKQLNGFLMLLVAFMTMCVTQVWGETYTIVFKTNTSDGNSTIASNLAVTNAVSSGSEYISGFTNTSSKAYYNSINGIKLGTNSAVGIVEFNIAESYRANIKSITIKSAKYGSDTGTLTLYSGSTSLKIGITPGTDYTHNFATPTTVSSIKVATSSKRAYVSQIILETGSTSPAVSVSGDLNNFTYAADDGPSASQSFTVSGSNLTANLVVTAPTGYEVCKTADGSYASSISFTPSIGSVASTTAYIRLKSGLSQGSYDGNITVSSTGAANQTKAVTGSVTAAVVKYTVTWHIGSGTQTTLNVADQTAFSSLSAPEVADNAAGSCANKFMGWATSPISGTTNGTGYDAIKVSGSTKVTSTCKDFYAVFATEEGGDETWTQTTLSSLTSSDVFVMASGTNAISSANGTSGNPAAVALTVSAGKITSEVTDAIKWTLTGNATDGYTFYKAETSNYLYVNTTASSGSNTCIRVGTQSSNIRNNWKPDTNGYLKTNDSYTARYLSFYSTGSDFRGYVNTSNGAFAPTFYKLTGGSTYTDV